ncbi:MAG: DUF4926 domain-containing protein [Anaerolineae bacterium]
MKNGPDLFDVVELLVDLPEYHLRVGARGAIVHCHPDNTYEVEFTNEEGETLALCPLSPQQFIVVWRARTRAWVPASEQIAALLTRLPEEMEREVLDFARFLHARRQQQQGEAPVEPTRIARTASS